MNLHTLTYGRTDNTCDEVAERSMYYAILHREGVNPTPAPPEERCSECFMYGEHDSRCPTLFKMKVERAEDYGEQRPAESM